MGTAVEVHNRSIRTVCDYFDGSIQHGVYKLGVRTRAHEPTDHKPVEAVDHGRQIYLARRQVEFCDIGEPFLVWRHGLEITIDQVLRSDVL